MTSITTHDILEKNVDTVCYGVTKTEEAVRTHILKTFFDQLKEKTWTDRERETFLKELRAQSEK